MVYRLQCMLVFIMSTLLAYGQINPARPDLLPTKYALDSIPQSTIIIPIQVNLKPLFAMFENSVDKVFTSPNYPNDWVYNGCDVRYKYQFKRSPLQIKASGTTLDVGFMGYYRIAGSTRVCVSGLAVTPWSSPCNCGYNEDDRRVQVGYTCGIQVLTNHKVRINVNRKEPVPLDKCEVCFWKQDITSIVLAGLKGELDASKKEIEKKYGLVDLSPYFKKIWESLVQPVNLQGYGWLNLNPTKLFLSTLYARNDSLFIGLGVGTKSYVSFEKPAISNAVLPLIEATRSPQGFSITLDARLHYDTLTRILNENAAHTEIEFKKAFVSKKIVFDAFQVYSDGNEKLVVKVFFSGSNNGVFYLTGKPVFNNSTQVISLDNLDFDIKSKNVLLKSASWIFDKKITQVIEKKARFEMKSYFDSAVQVMGMQMNKEWMKGVKSYGQVQNVNIAGIYPLPSQLLIRTTCKGLLGVNVSALTF